MVFAAKWSLLCSSIGLSFAVVLRRWRRSPHLYVRRASAVGLIGLARRGRHLDEAYGAARALASEDHHLIQKAVGWLLREAGKTDPARLERFLRAHGRRLGRTSVRYAIERFPERKRRELLAATKPSGSWHSGCDSRCVHRAIALLMVLLSAASCSRAAPEKLDPVSPEAGARATVRR